MATINFDALPKATEREYDPTANKGAKFDPNSVPQRIREDVEAHLQTNLKRAEEGQPTQFWTQECGSADVAQAFLKYLTKYAEYRPDGQITVRVSNRADVKAGKATAVHYAPKALERRPQGKAGK